MESKTFDSHSESESSDYFNTEESFDPNVTRRKHSFVWQYFRQIGETKSYECTLCKACVGSQTSNLARHLTCTHNIKKQPDGAISSISKRGRPSKSFIWKYCSKQDENYVRCGQCSKLLYFGTGNTQNVAKHLRRKHSDILDPADRINSQHKIDDTIETDQAIATIDDQNLANNDNLVTALSISRIARDRKERKGGSYVWNYCDKLSRHEIRCNLCNKNMSFHGTANVITHLQRKHNIIGKIGDDRTTLDNSLPDTGHDDEQEQSQLVEENKFRQYRRSSATSSIVWKYCTRVGRDVARCGFCKKNLSYQGTSNLQRHLHRMHGVVTQLRITRNEDAEYSTEDFISKHCSVVEGEDDKTKCNLCNALFDSKDVEEISKHLCTLHGIEKQTRRSPRKRKRRRSITDDDTSSYENGDYDNAWSKNDNSNDATMFDESNIKKGESIFDDIIEEDHEYANYEEEPFDPSMIQEIPLANPLSAHSSRAPSPTNHGKQIFKSKKLQQLNEEKVKMETEYFREKAGFYRMQKYLTALQAKKIRNELEQLNNAVHVKCVIPNDFSSNLPVTEL